MKECNVVLMSLQIVYFVFFGAEFRGNASFVSEVSFENGVNVMGFAYVS